MLRRYRRILAQVLAEPADTYTDAAMAPVDEAGDEHLALFTATAAAREFVQKRRLRKAVLGGA
jgi:hypothetical protein